METAMRFDEIANALGDRARRRLLVELLDHNPVAYREAREWGATDDGRETGVEMVHVHLPKLDEMGYIVWDEDAETIVKGPEWEEIEPVVRLLSHNREQLPEDTF